MQAQQGERGATSHVMIVSVVDFTAHACIPGLGFRIQGAVCGVQGAGFRVQGLGFRVQGAGCGVQGAGRTCVPIRTVAAPAPDGANLFEGYAFGFEGSAFSVEG